jgi:hypothetical protein
MSIRITPVENKIRNQWQARGLRQRSITMSIRIAASKLSN